LTLRQRQRRRLLHLWGVVSGYLFTGGSPNCVKAFPSIPLHSMPDPIPDLGAISLSPGILEPGYERDLVSAWRGSLAGCDDSGREAKAVPNSLDWYCG
jgi:hypothetical protein